MALDRILRRIVMIALSAALVACSNSDGERSAPAQEEEERETIWDLFENRDDVASPVRANRYLWHASLDILDFLPVESIDPFTGVIVTGWGQPPGGGREFRATILIDDPALDARSLDLVLDTRSGPADPDTVHEVENAILTRARQMRVERLSF
ncbi:MAG: DUF3576 domain-containing protein [Rhodobacteraceae bacterium]|nr:DUF3576 domain-containing protein [Paracoccaceae bacterium]